MTTARPRQLRWHLLARHSVEFARLRRRVYCSNSWDDQVQSPVIVVTYRRFRLNRQRAATSNTTRVPRTHRRSPRFSRTKAVPRHRPAPRSTLVEDYPVACVDQTTFFFDSHRCVKILPDGAYQPYYCVPHISKRNISPSINIPAQTSSGGRNKRLQARQ